MDGHLFRQDPLIAKGNPVSGSAHPTDNPTTERVALIEPPPWIEAVHRYRGGADVDVRFGGKSYRVELYDTGNEDSPRSAASVCVHSRSTNFDPHLRDLWRIPKPITRRAKLIVDLALLGMGA